MDTERGAGEMPDGGPVSRILVDWRDAKALVDLRSLARRPNRDLAAFRAMEAALSPAARRAWFTWTSDRLARELARWRPGYRIERTRQGVPGLPVDQEAHNLRIDA